MPVTLLAVDAAGRRARTLTVTTERGATVAAVAASLVGEPALAGAGLGAGSNVTMLRAPEPPALFLGTQQLPPGLAWDESGVRDGSVLGIGGAVPAWPEEPTGVVELRVVGGPAAGTVHRLGLGEHTVGSAGSVRIDDPAVPARALLLSAGPAGVSVRPAPGAQARLESEPIGEGGVEHWQPGDQISIGSSVLALHSTTRPDANLTPGDDNGLAYNRPPRMAPFRQVPSLEVPKPPGKTQGVHFPLLMLVAPLLLGAAFYLISRRTGNANPSFLLLMVLSPLMLAGNAISDKRAGRKQGKAAKKEYAAACVTFEEEVRKATRTDELNRRVDAPDAAELMLTAVGPRRRLWERRVYDPDALRLRIGSRDMPAGIDLITPSDTPAPPTPTSRQVPITLPLRELGVVGVAGPVAPRTGLMRWLLVQVGVLHSPREVSAVVLTTQPADDPQPVWEWTRWLPHLAPQGGQDAQVLIGNDRETCSRRTAELAQIVAARKEQASGGGFGSDATAFAPIVVVLDGARALRRLPGMPSVLADGPRVAVYAICIDDDERLLPEECRAVVGVDPDGVHAHVYVTGAEPLHGVLADQVTNAFAERVGRSLAFIRDVSRDDEGGALPGSVRLLEQLQLDPPGPQAIAQIWQSGGRSTRSLLGVGAQGAFSVDMVVDGPHGLVAGTTGAGKSELLQTMIASLAVANKPSEFTFVLIDYKGGAAFKDCAKLPHTVGMVTDLDGHLTSRALESLAAELRRREHQLAGADAKDIEDYLETMGPRSEPMPRLMIVIDEFASLVAELPDFVTGLVDIARRGRSLGVHLILATQRPAGVVSADIAANTNLRIALRVTDESESRDVVDSPESARISKTTPGRAYARLGHSSLVPFQSARVGGRPPGVGGQAVTVQESPWASAGRRLASTEGPQSSAADTETDLADLVRAINAAHDGLHLVAPPSPWLEPLPGLVTLDDLSPAAATADGSVPLIPYALADVPTEQARRTESFDLQHGGHLMVVGAPRTGRSTLLRTIAGSIARTVSAADVHVHAIDCGNNAMLPLVSLPHCGAVVSRDQADRLERLLAQLGAQVTARQQQLAALGYADIAEQRAGAEPEQRLPYIVVMLDRWEGFMAAFDEYDGGRLVDIVYRLLAEGAGVGVRFIISSDRSGMIGKVSTTVEDRVLLRLADYTDYTLAGLDSKTMPESLPAGRGVTSADQTELQIALLAADAQGTAQVAALQAIGRDAEARTGEIPPAQRPQRVDALPSSVTVADALALAPTPVAVEQGSGRLLVGVGGDTLAPRFLDLVDDGPGLLVAGPQKSGRSSTLATMLTCLLDAGWQAMILTPRQSPLRGWSAREGIVAVHDGSVDGAELTEQWDAIASPKVLVVDDLELIGPDHLLSDPLSELLASVRDSGNGILAAGTTEDLSSQYRGFSVELRKSRAGVLLTPVTYSDGDVFGLRLPRSTGGQAPAGRGLLTSGGAYEPIQVALAD